MEQVKSAETENLEKEGNAQTGTENVNQEGQEKQKEERLFGGVFKTQDDLEQGYINSNRENIRMAQEIKRLNTMLQQANTPEKKEAIQEKIDDLAKYFDPETAKILSTWTKQQIAEAIKEDREIFTRDTEFRNQVSENWEETKKLFPDAANPQSKLYQRANEILFERNLAEVDSNGVIKLLTPFAYRIAIEAAYMELGRASSENAVNKDKKSQASFVQGKGSKTVGAGKLTYDQYSKLSDEEKDAYDSQFKGR